MIPGLLLKISAGETWSRQNLKFIDQVNRSDVWIEAAKALGEEGLIPPDTLSRGVETFFDGLNFDPTNPSDYLNQLTIKKV
jgi:nitrate/nitrite transport system substrate-binding protein